MTLSLVVYQVLVGSNAMDVMGSFFKYLMDTTPAGRRETALVFAFSGQFGHPQKGSVRQAEGLAAQTLFHLKEEISSMSGTSSTLKIAFSFSSYEFLKKVCLKKSFL